MKNDFRETIKKIPRECILAFFSSLVFSLLAHGYRFANLMFSHDSLVIDQTLDTVHKVALGRYLQPVYWLFRGGLTAPFLIGVCSAVFLGAAVSLTLSLFQIKSTPAILLLSGILSTNATLTYTHATYIHESDAFMLSLLLAVGAAYLFRKAKGGIWKGALLLAVSMGLYQSYMQVTVLLLMLLFFFDLLDGSPAKEVFVQGLKAIGMFLVSAVVYYGLFRLVLVVTGIMQEENYNGMGSLGDFGRVSIVHLFVETYRKLFHIFHTPEAYLFIDFPQGMSGQYLRWLIAGVNILLIGAAAIAFLAHCKKAKLPAMNLLLAAGLAALMPFGGNMVNFISKGLEHSLMMYAAYLLYIPVLLLLTRYVSKPKIAQAVCILFALLIWNNIVFANQFYLKKQLQEQATLSFMTRLADRIEQTEGYIPGETPIILVGDYKNTAHLQPLQGFEPLDGVGSTATLTVTNTENIRQYLRFILNEPVNIVGEAQPEDAPVYAALPTFPLAGSVTVENGTVLVRLS